MSVNIQVLTKMRIKFAFLEDHIAPVFVTGGTKVTGSPRTFQPSNKLPGVISQESTRSTRIKNFINCKDKWMLN
jgi:hypothetical protein